ncbi:type VI secretion system tube protein Hcp [Acetobacteraceae bacterium]|nr:type VI secretion system tube protein Hcp [Acetobacteraceae bacterium]
MALYMKIDGVVGDVTEAKHKGWIELNSSNWGMKRNIRSAVGNAKNRESASAGCKEFTFKKPIDSSSPRLVSLAFTGQAQPTVQIDVTRVNQGGEAVVRSIELKNAILSSFDNPLSSLQPPMEVGSFNFTQITISDFGTDEKGLTGTPKRTTYDLGQAKTL